MAGMDHRPKPLQIPSPRANHNSPTPEPSINPEALKHLDVGNANTYKLQAAEAFPCEFGDLSEEVRGLLSLEFRVQV